MQNELTEVIRNLHSYIRLLSDFGVRSVRAFDDSCKDEESLGDSARELSSDPEMELQALRSRIGQCSRCPLSTGRKSIVFGEGNAGASLVLVGEGPGKEEDLTAKPFVGEAGRLLDKILKAMGLDRGQVYICNVVKCRPPKNRVPTEEEMSVCGRFLDEQLSIIRPRHILALGSTATRYLLKTDKSIGKLRGRFFVHESTGARVMPTYHPAYLLRNESAKRPVWADVQQVMAEMDVPRRSLDHETD